MLFNCFLYIHPTFNFIFHFFATSWTKPFKRHCRLTLVTRILKIKFNLKIITKLFVFQNRIRLNAFLIELVLVGLVINKTGVHCKPAHHLFAFSIHQSELDISAQLHTLPGVFVYYIKLHHVVFSYFVLLQDSLGLLFLSVFVLIVRVVCPNNTEICSVKNFYAWYDVGTSSLRKGFYVYFIQLFPDRTLNLLF